MDSIFSILLNVNVTFVLVLVLSRLLLCIGRLAAFAFWPFPLPVGIGLALALLLLCSFLGSPSAGPSLIAWLFFGFGRSQAFPLALAVAGSARTIYRNFLQLFQPVVHL